MADLSALRELYAFMRESGVAYARCGELELRLEAMPLPPPVAVPVAVLPDASPDDGADDERRSLEAMLFSSGVDPDDFLRAMGKPRAA